AATKAAPKKAPAPDPAKWPIESLRVEGNHNYTREQVLAVAGVKVGQMAGKPEFDAARDRLVSSGAFETVGYRFEPATSHVGANHVGANHAGANQAGASQPEAS